MIERFSAAVVVHKEADDLAEFLREAKVPDDAVASLTEEQQADFYQAFGDLADTPFNTAGGGGVSTILLKVHFRLRKTLFTAALLLVELKIAFVSGDPGRYLDLALHALHAARTLFTPLSDTERNVCYALLAIMKRRKDAQLTPLGGTEPAIESQMREMEYRIPGDLHQILIRLSSGESPVLIAEEDGDQTCYRVTT
jgi:hypothetical protein